MLTKISEALYVALHALRKNAEWQPQIDFVKFETNVFSDF